MNISFQKLLIEINNNQFIFAVIGINESGNFKLIHKNLVPIEGFGNKKIFDIDLVYSLFKKNIYLLEQKLNITFKEAVIILDNFNLFQINLSGFKKLNGSQLVKENITYIINSLKSKVSEIEFDKTILHIFNAKFILDKKKIENLPIGLFGNFYSHELSFLLIKKNDYKNIQTIFDKCNLKIKKIISKDFIEGAKIINENNNLNTFINIKIDENYSQIIFFENASLKFIQPFYFGSEIIINDISKVIGLKTEIVKNILLNSSFTKDSLEKENLEEKFFEKSKFKNIRKKLIFDVAKARIQELSELILTKNINMNSFLKNDTPIFLNIEDKLNFECFNEDYRSFFSADNIKRLNFLRDSSLEDTYFNAHSIVQYGWNKEAVPIVQEKSSILSRFFNIFFK